MRDQNEQIADNLRGLAEVVASGEYAAMAAVVILPDGSSNDICFCSSEKAGIAVIGVLFSLATDLRANIRANRRTSRIARPGVTDIAKINLDKN